tara:strand:- start:451 stop:1212 length:762 start_codon:yes stop_codon:yes gene_type:complete
VLGDIHGPWLNQRRLDLVLDIAQDLDCSHIIINGDCLDFYHLNSYGPKHADVQTILEDEIYWGQEFLKSLRKRFPKKGIIFLFGNHEYRLDRFIMKHCPAFWNFLKLEKMLNLEDLNIEWLPYNERYQIEKTQLFVQHSPPSYSDNLANTSMKKKMDQDHIWNCAHRTDMVARTGSSGKIYTSYINGWFGSTGIIGKNQREMPENRRVFSFTKNHESWNSSFCLVGVDGKNHYVEQVLIKDYTAMVGGNLYEG